jgi:hypothetical protein
MSSNVSNDWIIGPGWNQNSEGFTSGGGEGYHYYKKKRSTKRAVDKKR